MNDTDQIKRIYWSMAEVTEYFQISGSCVRFWLEQFNVEVRRNRKGNRLFSHTEIEKLTQIHYLLRVRKFTLEGARQELGIK